MSARRKLWSAIPAAVVCAALLLTACGGSAKKATTTTVSANDQSIPAPTFPAGSTMATIQQRGRLKVGVRFDQVGLGLKSGTAAPVGFDIEIAQLIAQGIFGGTKADAASKIDYTEAVATNREAFLKSGNVDIVVATYSQTDDRKAIVGFAGPYYTAHGDIVVKATDTTIASVTDLNGKTVCTENGAAYAATLKIKAPQAGLNQLAKYADCVAAVSAGTASAITGDSATLANIVQQSSGALKLLNPPFVDDPYGIGVKKGDTTFQDFLNDRLKTVEGNGQWASAFVATLGKLGLATPTPPTIDRYYASSTSTTGAGATTTAVGAVTTTTKAAGAGTTTTVPSGTTTSITQPYYAD